MDDLFAPRIPVLNPNDEIKIEWVDQAARDAHDRELASIIARAIFPSSFSDTAQVATVMAGAKTVEQNRALLINICLPAIAEMRAKGFIR